MHSKLSSVSQVAGMVFSQCSDLLWAGWSRDRIPVGARFSAPLQTSPGAHPASYAMGTGSFLGVKQPGCGIDHPHPSSAKVKKRVELYLFSSSGPLWPVLGWPLPLPKSLQVTCIWDWTQWCTAAGPWLRSLS